MKAIIVLFFLLGFSLFVLGQGNRCKQKLELTNVSKDVDDFLKIDFQISSSEAFEIKVLRFSSSGEEVVKSIRGFGNDGFKVERLDPSFVHNVVVVFKDEQKFLCKTKVLHDVLTERNWLDKWWTSFLSCFL